MRSPLVVANVSLGILSSRRYNPRMPTPPEILATRPARESRFLRVEEVDLAFSNGARRTFERLTASGRGAVLIVPMRIFVWRPATANASGLPMR